MKAWQNFLSQLEKDIGKTNIDQWARSLTVVKYDACNLYLQANDSFQAQWFYEHIHPKLSDFVNNNQRAIRVHLEVLQEVPSSKKKTKQPILNTFVIKSDMMHPNYSFGSYVATEKNHLTLEFLARLSSSRENFSQISQTNPMYLYGKKGVGKTHLLTAMGQSLSDLGLRVFFVKAETFASHFVNAIRQNCMQLFRESYRNIDVLIVDDVHIFSKKNATQEEFFHTFNTLHTQGKGILLSSQVSPRELSEIEPRLVSRFEWGITLKLEPPEPGDLQKILEKKAQFHHFNIDQDLITFLLTTFQSSPKSLYEALDALLIRSHDQKMTKILPETAQVLLKDLIEKENQNKLSSTDIIRTVAAHYGIKEDDILGKAQSRDIALPRKIAIFFCREKLKLPYQKIGKIFQRDHSTIMSSEKFILTELQKKSRELEQSVSILSRKLENKHLQ